jgi:hypothetical protein
LYSPAGGEGDEGEVTRGARGDGEGEESQRAIRFGDELSHFRRDGLRGAVHVERHLAPRHERPML